MSIRLNTNYEEKDDVKVLGAIYNRKDKHWYIPDGMDYHPFKKWIPDDVYVQLENTQSEVYSLSNFFNTIAKQCIIPGQIYTIKADVHDMYTIPSASLNTHYLYTLISEHDLRKSIKVIVSKEILRGCKAEDLIDKEVTATGNLTIYNKYLTFQLNAIKIEINGDCTRIKNFKKWKEEYFNHFKNDTNTKIPPVISFSKIGLITNERTRAYGDFFDKIHSNKISNSDIIIKNVPLNKTNIIQAINELNNEKECQIICIIRGGGDPEELIDFSHPDLLNAILESEIPIVTGIGHKDDELLCDYVAKYNAKTPSGVADYLNYVVGKQRKDFLQQQSYHAQSKNEYERIDWKAKYNEAELKIYELEQEIADLKSKLDKKNNRSIIGRIFNW